MTETEKALYLGMAKLFDEDPDLLTLDTRELTKKFEGTTHSRWRDFLNLPEVALFSGHITKSNMAIAFRKAQKALTTEASQGNTQAAKQITDLSNFLANNQNKVVHILTYVPRYPINTNKPNPIERSETERTEGGGETESEANSGGESLSDKWVMVLPKMVLPKIEGPEEITDGE